MAVPLETLGTECYLWHSDWLKIPGWRAILSTFWLAEPSRVTGCPFWLAQSFRVTDNLFWLAEASQVTGSLFWLAKASQVTGSPEHILNGWTFPGDWQPFFDWLKLPGDWQPWTLCSYKRVRLKDRDKIVHTGWYILLQSCFEILELTIDVPERYFRSTKKYNTRSHDIMGAVEIPFIIIIIIIIKRVTIAVGQSHVHCFVAFGSNRLLLLCFCLCLWDGQTDCSQQGDQEYQFVNNASNSAGPQRITNRPERTRVSWKASKPQPAASRSPPPSTTRPWTAPDGPASTPPARC